MSLEPQFHNSTIQTTKPVCLQTKGHRGFLSLAVSWRGGQGGLYCVGIHLQPQPPLLSSICCGSSAESSAAPASCLPWKESVVRNIPPQERDHSWALCYAAHTLSTCCGTWPAFVSVTFIVFLNSGPLSGSGHCPATAGFWPMMESHAAGSGLSQQGWPSRLGVSNNQQTTCEEKEPPDKLETILLALPLQPQRPFLQPPLLRESPKTHNGIFILFFFSLSRNDLQFFWLKIEN